MFSSQVIGARDRGGLGRFGRLVGDIRAGNEQLRFYAPFASMLLISVVRSLLVALQRPPPYRTTR